MKGITHILFAVLIGIVYISYFNIEQGLLFLGFIILGALLPDIDTSNSIISNKTKPFSWLVTGVARHRGLFHTIYIPIGFYVLAWLFPRFEIVFIALLFGYLSHLFIDALTPQGIQLFYPFKTRLKGFIKTGSILEFLVDIVIVFCIFKLAYL